MLTRSLSSKPLSSEWKDRLGLDNRSDTELHEDPREVRWSPHANAVRKILEDLGASAVFCVQGAPSIVIFVLEEYESDEIIDLHGALWNQGLASLLLVLTDDTVRAFSLGRIPCTYEDDQEFERRCLIQMLNAVTDVPAIKDMVYGAESGRLWERHYEYFKVGERVDRVLLKNLTVSHDQLRMSGLSEESAQALLIQTMFVAYLEDRGIVGKEYFRSASGGISETLVELLEATSTTALNRLFDQLHTDFSGDLFVAPCSFDADRDKSTIGPVHLQTLARFRDGREIMDENGDQLRFWGYDFKYVPIELMSSVYDQFLGRQEAQRLKSGAYYTPMFVADTVISVLWDTMSETVKSNGRFLDPACGSGVFLVRSFQRLCEHWRETHRSWTIRWDNLIRILSRLSGYDTNAGALRVAVFSLYVALLEEATLMDLVQLSKKEGLLPELWDRTLRAQDFFQASETELKAEVILGNPPWSSRRGRGSSSVTWCQDHQFPAPSKGVAWGFVWKSLGHLSKHGTLGFLLPARGFLHNQAKTAVQARIRLVEQTRIFRIVNFSDLRFQLFEDAKQAATLVVLRKRETKTSGYRFDYWMPKADLNLKMRRSITITSMDKTSIASFDVREDPLVFKQRLRLSNPESKLLGYLKALPTLGELVSEYGVANRMRESSENHWVIGHGFKPAQKHRLVDDKYQAQQSEAVSTIPYLPIEAFQVLAQDTKHLRRFNEGVDGLVYRRGFERGFTGIRVLIPKGISVGSKRLRASYTAKPLTFRENILAVSVPELETRKAKLFTALLNSKLLFWFAFHGTELFESDRPIIRQADLLRLPFPGTGDFLRDDQSIEAESELVAIIDREPVRETNWSDLDSNEVELLNQLDSHCYSYFGLGEEEIALVEDSVAHLIPNVWSHTSRPTDLWQPASRQERAEYANTLSSSLAQWFDDNATVQIGLEAKNNDLAVLRVLLVELDEPNSYNERNDQTVEAVLSRLRAHLDEPIPGNFQLVPDFRMFVEESLYLVKPLQRRYWLKPSAISDANAIAMDLQDVVLGQWHEVRRV